MVPKMGMPKSFSAEHGGGAGEAGDVARPRGQHAGLGAVRPAEPEIDQRACPRAASTTRAALEAMSVSKCRRLISRVSTSCASGSGAVTRRIGSSAKTGVPSGMAWTSPVKRSDLR